MIEAVIWDFGGVLTSSPFEAFARFEVEHGLPVKFEDQALEALRVQLHANQAQARTGSAPATGDMTLQMHPPAPSHESVARAEPAVAVPASTSPFVPEASPLPDVDLRADQKAEARAELVAALGEQGREVREIAEQVLYAGKVREVTPSGLLVQSVSRNAVVIHDLARLEGRFEVGQEVEIRYNDGRGSDGLQGKPHDQGVNR